MRNDTMTKMLKKLVYTLTLALGALAAPLGAEAATTGDIYEIHPCDAFGAVETRTDLSEPLKGGETARFVVRLVKPAMTAYDGRFYVVPRKPGLTKEELEALTKFEIGVYVNGRLTTATLENTFYPDESSANRFFTDLVFTYKVEPGDFARPIRLADSAGNMIVSGSEFSGEFFVSPASKTAWKITNYTDDTKTTQDVEAKFAYRPQSEIADWGVKPPDHVARVVDTDLTGCYFFVETVDFDANWEVAKTASDPGLWRSVHQDTTKTEGYQPSLKVEGTPVSSTKLYVWCDDESAVFLKKANTSKSGTTSVMTRTIHIDASGTTAEVQMLEVQVVAGETEYDFDIRGVAEGKSANLVLSAFPDYNYTKGLAENKRIEDYITVPVKCLAPLPPSVTVKASTTKPVEVDANYKVPALELSVEVSGIDSFAAGACKVTLTPALRNVVGADWEKYVHVNDEYNPDAENDWARTGALDLTFTANGAKKVYVFALGADANTASLEKGVQFNVEENGSSYLEKGGSTLVYFKSTPPTLDIAKKAYETTAKTPVTFDLKVSDCYKNMTDKGGYTVYYRNGAADWKAMDGKWQPDANGLLCKLGEDGNPTQEHPSVKYVLENTYKTSFYVAAPAPSTAVSDMIDPLEVTVTVNKGATLSGEISGDEGKTWVDNGKFSEGTEMMVRVNLSKPNGEENPIYAFLAPVGDTVDSVSGDVLTNSVTSYGMEIMSGETNSVAGLFKITDGTRTGKTLRFDLLLCKTQKFDAKELVDGYEGKTLQFVAMNVIPAVAQVTMDKVAKVKESEQTMYTGSDKAPKTAVVPLGMTKKFEFKINEPGDIDLTTAVTADRFRLDYSVLEENGASASGELYGNPNLTNFTYKFTYAGTATVTLKLKDKDMSEMGEEFVFYVVVAKQPQIMFDVPSSVIEGSVGLANAPITLTFSDKSAPDVADGLVAKITVTNNEATETDPRKLGYLKLGGLEPWTDETGAVVAGAYKGTFNALGQLKFFVDDTDGTQKTASKGFTLHAEIVTDSMNPVAKQRWCDYYLANDTVLLPQNEKPSFTSSLGDDNKVNTNAVRVGLGQVITVKYNVDDIQADLDAGITVQWNDSDNGDAQQVTVTNRAQQTFSTKFKNSGKNKHISVTVTDKDGGKVSYEWNFDVDTAKVLYTVPNGPSQGIGNSAVSAAFAGARGNGKGHVWSPATFASADNFLIQWTCGLQNSVNVFGWGYKVGSKDDGWLDSESTRYLHDIPLTPLGNNSIEGGKGELTEGFYEYQGDYDSFLCCWITHSTGDGKSGGGAGGTGGGSGSGLVSTFTGLAPEKTGKPAMPAVATLPTQDANSGSAAGTTASAGDVVYPDTYMEAVFARELLPSDNMGDINADGIPDVYYAVSELISTDGTGEGDVDYKAYLKDLNFTDEGEPACVEGDYLPTTESAVYGAFIPGLKETWAKVGRPFVPRVKVRGYDETDALSIANRGTSVSALNDAPEQAHVLDVKPDRVYTNPRTDAKSTLNYVEWLAWSEFKAQYELEHPGTEAPVTAWSPERPTDPALKDTDGDGLPDGYEYYFWYLAHVGWVDENGNHRRLTGHRYDPRNPGVGTLLTADKIAAALDPRNNQIGSLLADTDNDGLPDILEFEIGTNPVEFDTDGDGLPDGWELMIAGLDPLTDVTSKDAPVDTLRNYDGDAMAISSYLLEKNQMPVAKEIEHAKRWTFAVIDADGDTDGVQWYAMTNSPAACFEEDTDATLTTWYEASVGEVKYCFVTQPAVVDGRLAADTVAYTIGAFTPPEPDPDDDDDDEEDETTLRASAPDEGGEPARGYPVLLSAGTVLSSEPEEKTEPLKTWKIKDGGIEAALANACWIYGKGAADTAAGEVAESAAEYGCLALGRNCAVKAGAVVCAMPSDARDVAFLHYLCYQEFGFDPRTAWSSVDPLAPRWGVISAEGETLSGTVGLHLGGYTGIPARTRDYTAYDEFLVYSFFLNNGVEMSGKTWLADDEAGALARTWSAFTTNPQGPDEPGLIYEDHYYGRSSVLGEQVAINGADTDNDHVPDGWELYVMAGPKDSETGAYVFAPPYAGFKAGCGTVEIPTSAFSPFVNASETEETFNPAFTGVTTDMMNEWRKFAGTDTCAYYADYSETVGERPAKDVNWLNKFFPCDPWSGDTDGDGIVDSAEGVTTLNGFIYGTPYDNGLLVSIPGGGLNPLSVDTDRDGLPDPWELQFKGNHSSLYAGDMPSYAKDADGNPQGNPLQGLTDGMDGTVADAFNYPRDNNGYVITVNFANGMNQDVDRDYDHDGLDNWQEYLTGTMRAWRYDDPVTPMNGIPASTYFKPNEDGDLVFDPKQAAKDLGFGDDDAAVGEFWYRTLVDSSSELYNPHLVTDTCAGSMYFSRVENVWDSVYMDADLSLGAVSGSYYWFYNRVGDVYLSTAWAQCWKDKLGIDGYDAVPARYASCSPIDPDSDHDGMDDYYEVFHGMNPLLGASGVEGKWTPSQRTDHGAIHDGDAFDLVYDSLSSMSGKNPQAWGTGDEESNYKNFWQRLWAKRAESAASDEEDKYVGPLPRGTGFDFVFYPWLGGLATADADGDGMRNQEEAIMPLISPTTAWHHTDPTALWMTDSSYSNSIVRTSYRLPVRDALSIKDLGESFTFEGKEYAFAQFDGFDGEDVIAFNPDFSFWGLGSTEKNMNYIASFEENEGFDTDHDGLADHDELGAKYGSLTDPLEGDSPRRRQAMYFQGKERPSVLQSLPFVSEKHPNSERSNRYPDDMSLLQFTVECWARPESLDNATLLERVMWTERSNPNDSEFMRCNFRLSVTDGKWRAKYDPNDTTSNEVAVASTISATTNWTHLAATYDGKELCLYVDGVRQGATPSQLQPSYGSSAVAVNGMAGEHAEPGMAYWRDSEHKLDAFVIGASAKTCADGAKDGKALDVTEGVGLDAYTSFYKGYIDEVRVWDGARSASDIQSAMRTRFTAEMAAANRKQFFDEWSQPAATGLYRGRYAKDGNGNAYALPCELRYHWSFDSVFGAGSEEAVAKVPAGFNYMGADGTGTGRAVQTRPEGYEIAWWKKVLDGYGSVYAGATNWVTWIPNTVTHLPRFDGTTLDSRYWSADFAGAEAGAYMFARTAEPVSLWTQYTRSGAYSTTGSRNFFVSTKDRNENTSLATLYDFTGRHLNQSGDDLLPLGGAYVKHTDDMWDGQGSSSNWEVSGSDRDGDGLPDWWDDYADENYRDATTTAPGQIVWDTYVLWPDNNGVRIKAGEAFLRDLARGFHANSAGDLVDDGSDGNYVQRSDTDGNGLPDWWQRLYGLAEGDIYADTDNDGLSDYAEYMLSEVFKFRNIRFSPIEPCSADPYTPDYFFKVGELYVGEIFTDHDFMDDLWEDAFTEDVVSRFAYDPDGDADGDGWSNRSEFFAGTDPSRMNHAGIEDSFIADYPVPMIHASVKVPTTISKAAPIVIQAFSGADFSAPDAVWQTSASEGSFSKEKIVGTNPCVTRRYFLSPGSISPGQVAVLFNDENAVTYYYQIISGESKLTKSVITGSGWYPVVTDRMRTDGGIIGDLVKYTGDIVGWINYKTGEAELWFDKPVLEWARYLGETGTAGTGDNAVATETATEMDLLRASVKFAWTASLSTQGSRAEFYLSDTDSGIVREGLNTFVAYADENGDGAYSPGEAYGIVSGVDVSWSGTALQIELTKLSPVTPRLRLWSGSSGEEDGSKSGGGSGGEGGASIEADRIRTVTEIETEIREAIYAKHLPAAALSNELAATRWMEANVPVDPELPANGFVRIRVVRWLVDGMPLYQAGVSARTVLDRYYDVSREAVLTEADFVGDGSFDLDWANLSTEAAGRRGMKEIDYLIVVGEGATGWQSEADTNVTVRAFQQVIARKFGEKRVTPVVLSPSAAAGQVVTSARPTFKWSVNESEVAAYTAFKVQVRNADGKLVYDSGVRPAPVRDENGNYVWKAALCADDRAAGSEADYANNARYTWQVSMYNAKYASDSFSASGSYLLSVETNRLSYGSADVAVKYFGPRKSYQNKTIRVRAFESADFTGEPVAAGYVALPDDPETGVSVTGRAVKANCRLIGIPEGTYYLQAFIDSNNNGVYDAWESMGYLCGRAEFKANWQVPASMTFGPDVGSRERATIFVEDADTDGDSLPDAWEYAEYGALDKAGCASVDVLKAGELVANKTLIGDLEDNIVASADIRGGLSGRVVRTLLASPVHAALALGLEPESVTTDGEGGLVVKSSVVNGSLTISDFSFDAAKGEVALSVDAAVDSPATDVTSPFYAVTVQAGAEVVVKVLHTATLAGEWAEVGRKTVVIGGSEGLDCGRIVLPIDGIEPTGGFFKVEIVQ